MKIVKNAFEKIKLTFVTMLGRSELKFKIHVNFFKASPTK